MFDFLKSNAEIIGAFAALLGIVGILFKWGRNIFSFLVGLLPRSLRRGHAPGPPEQQNSGPAFEVWSQVQELELFQAACLWAEKKPALPVVDDPEYAYLRMLKEAIAKKQLPAVLKLDEAIRLQQRQYQPNVKTKVDRSKLREFAKQRGLYPRFLFPCGPENLADRPKRQEKIERDTWLRDALFYIVLRRWEDEPDVLNETEHLNALFEAATDVCQKAVDGDLSIWGRTGFSGPFLKIPGEYWQYFNINALKVAVSDPEELSVERTTRAGANHPVYRALKTSRMQIEELWPSVP